MQIVDPSDEARERSPRFTLLGLMGLVGLIGVFATIAASLAIEERRHRNESDAISALRTIATAQSIFREGDKEGDGTLDYGNLVELSQTQLIDGVLGSGTKSGYVFDTAKSSSTGEFLWFAIANPEQPRRTGDRYFRTNHAGVIFATTAAPYSMNTTDCNICEGRLPGR